MEEESLIVNDESSDTNVQTAEPARDFGQLCPYAIDSRRNRGYYFLAATMHHANSSNPWIFVFFVALVLAIIAWGILSSRKRSQELSQIASQLGFTFMGNAWHGPTIDPRYKSCLLQHTRGRFDNVMVGIAGGLEAIVFDYTYSAGKSTITQTLACYSKKMQLPPFALKPEGLFDRIGDAFVHNDIDFPSHPVFSDRYALKSPDEAGTRQLFTPSLMSYMEQIPTDKQWRIETNATNLFVYRPGKSISPTDLSAFLQETSTVAQAIFSSEGLTNSTA